MPPVKPIPQLARQQGVSSGTAISNGRYTIEQAKGLPPGTYQVRIFSSTKSEAPRTPEEAALPAYHRPGWELIDARFNTATTLSIEVRPDADNIFDLDHGTSRRSTRVVAAGSVSAEFEWRAFRLNLATAASGLFAEVARLPDRLDDQITEDFHNLDGLGCSLLTLATTL